jgi:hypothetical protein
VIPSEFPTRVHLKREPVKRLLADLGHTDLEVRMVRLSGVTFVDIIGSKLFRTDLQSFVLNPSQIHSTAASLTYLSSIFDYRIRAKGMAEAVLPPRMQIRIFRSFLERELQLLARHNRAALLNVRRKPLF